MFGFGLASAVAKITCVCVCVDHEHPDDIHTYTHKQQQRRRRRRQKQIAAETPRQNENVVPNLNKLEPHPKKAIVRVFDESCASDAHTMKANLLDRKKSFSICDKTLDYEKNLIQLNQNR